MTDSGLFWAARRFYTRFDWLDQNEQNLALAVLDTASELGDRQVNLPFGYLPGQERTWLLLTSKRATFWRGLSRQSSWVKPSSG